MYATARDASIEAHLQVAGMSEEKLISVMDLALESGHLAAGDLAMLAAERCGFDLAMAHYSEQRGAADEAWAALWEEHVLGEELLGNMPENSSQKFESVFGDIDEYSISRGVREAGVGATGYSY